MPPRPSTTAKPTASIMTARPLLADAAGLAARVTALGDTLTSGSAVSSSRPVDSSSNAGSVASYAGAAREGAREAGATRVRVGEGVGFVVGVGGGALDGVGSGVSVSVGVVVLVGGGVVAGGDVA
jgi:hypothetical protein